MNTTHSAGSWQPELWAERGQGVCVQERQAGEDTNMPICSLVFQVPGQAWLTMVHTRGPISQL